MSVPKFSEIGRVDNVCPTCRSNLERRPDRKQPCPRCGNLIFVRTRPLDRKRVLLSAADVEKLEIEWKVFHEFGSPISPEQLSVHVAELGKHRRQFLLECSEAWKVGVKVRAQIIPTQGCAVSVDQAKKIYWPAELPNLPLEGCERFPERGCACCYVPVVDAT